MTATKSGKKLISIASIFLALLTILSISFIPTDAYTYIGKKKAKSIAVKNAKVKRKNVVFTQCKIETENGVKQYEVEFFSKRYKYEYEIKATNGRILDKEKEKLKNYKGKDISVKKAKSIAVKDAGFKKKDVKFKKCKLDVEKGYRVFAVKFTKGKKKYEYDINSKTGKIVDKEVERI